MFDALALYRWVLQVPPLKIHITFTGRCVIAFKTFVEERKIVHSTPNKVLKASIFLVEFNQGNYQNAKEKERKIDGFENLIFVEIKNRDIALGIGDKVEG